MKGGFIQRITNRSVWIYLEESGNETVNIYRHLESLFFNEFAMNSDYTNSNTVLQIEGELLLENFRQLCKTGDLVQIELWKSTVEEIIRLRGIVNNKKKVKGRRETPDEEQRRIRHEERRELWIPILEGITRLVEEARERFAREEETREQEAERDKKEREERDEAIARQFQIEQYLSDMRQNKQVNDTAQMIQEATIKKAIQESLTQEKVETKEEKVKKAEQEAKNVARAKRMKVLEAAIRKAEEIEQKEKEEDIAIEESAKLAAKETAEIEKVKNVKEGQLRETKEREKAALEKIISPQQISEIEERISTLKRFYTQRASYSNRARAFEKRDSSLLKQLKELSPGTPEYEKVALEYDSLDGEHAALNKLGSLFKEQDDEIKELEAKLKEYKNPSEEKLQESKKAQDELSLCKKEKDALMKPPFIKCSNPFCILPAIKPCSACKIAYYCGVTCQRVDWPKHKPFCIRNKKGGTKRKTKTKTRKRRT